MSPTTQANSQSFGPGSEDDSAPPPEAAGDISGLAPIWFETPCALTTRDPAFVMQIQRALQARGLYDGAVDGQYDGPTQSAAAAYQADLGLESGVLSTDAAIRLGLVPVRRETAAPRPTPLETDAAPSGSGSLPDGEDRPVPADGEGAAP